MNHAPCTIETLCVHVRASPGHFRPHNDLIINFLCVNTKGQIRRNFAIFMNTDNVISCDTVHFRSLVYTEKKTDPDEKVSKFLFFTTFWRFSWPEQSEAALSVRAMCINFWQLFLQSQHYVCRPEKS
jgi:hypothetical protein